MCTYTSHDININMILSRFYENFRKQKGTCAGGDLVYLVVIQDGCCVMLLLQRPQRALQHSLKVRHLTEDQSLTPTLFTDLLAANDLMTKSNTRNYLIACFSINRVFRCGKICDNTQTQTKVLQ